MKVYLTTACLVKKGLNYCVPISLSFWRMLQQPQKHGITFTGPVNEITTAQRMKIIFVSVMRLIFASGWAQPFLLSVTVTTGTLQIAVDFWSLTRRVSISIPDIEWMRLFAIPNPTSWAIFARWCKQSGFASSPFPTLFQIFYLT